MKTLRGQRGWDNGRVIADGLSLRRGTEGVMYGYLTVQLVYSCRDRVDVVVTIIINGNGQSGPSFEVFVCGRQL